MIQLGLSFGAGLLTAFSPCVLPVLPIVVGSAARSTSVGPLALASGLVTAFTGIGLLLASFGSVFGLDGDALRYLSAALLVTAGAILLSSTLQALLSRVAAPLASVSSRATTAAGSGAAGQFVVGAALGGVWSPCVGPTLGAAVGLATNTDTIAQAAMLMFTFGLGAAVPLLVIAYSGRRVLRHSPRLLRVSGVGKTAFGVLLVVIGLAVLAGLDRSLEAAVLERFPDWWVEVLAGV